MIDFQIKNEERTHMPYCRSAQNPRVTKKYSIYEQVEFTVRLLKSCLPYQYPIYCQWMTTL